jgi:CII-binding regulator of phage lambda lysogenization HflD
MTPKTTPTNSMVKTIVGIASTLFCAGLIAWASAISADADEANNQSNKNGHRLTVLETKFIADRKVIEKIDSKIEEIAPQQIRIEGKIDQILNIQTRQGIEIEKIKEKVQ